MGTAYNTPAPTALATIGWKYYLVFHHHCRLIQRQTVVPGTQAHPAHAGGDQDPVRRGAPGAVPRFRHRGDPGPGGVAVGRGVAIHEEGRTGTPKAAWAG